MGRRALALAIARAGGIGLIVLLATAATVSCDGEDIKVKPDPTDANGDTQSGDVDAADTVAPCVDVDTPCDDGDACTTGDTCDAQLRCIGTPTVCVDPGACRISVCSPASGACEEEALPDGSDCAEHLTCFSVASCEAGQCKASTASAVDCGPPPADDACVALLACKPGVGCVPTLYPASADHACDADDDPCTIDVCGGDAGCQSTGQLVDCSFMNTPCEPEHVCTDKAAPQGTPYTCVSADPGGRVGEPCPPEDGCHQPGMCEVVDGGIACVSAPFAVDLPDDCWLDYCVQPEPPATTGTVHHDPVPAQSACATACGAPGRCDGAGVCAPEVGQCCSDSDCAAHVTGTCAGTPTCLTEGPDAGTCAFLPDTAQPCPAATSACETVSCDATSGACLVAPKADWSNCDDNNACTVGEACSGGQCTGGAWTAGCCVTTTDCAAGTCEAGVCRCPTSWSGPACDVPICDPTCENGATCDAPDSCDCLAGYSGPTCGTDVDDCDPNPCLNGGSCDDGVNSFTCDCVTGFSGPICDDNHDDCDPDPCLNGGACTDGVDSFTCECAPGYDGPTCAIDIDDCDPNPCLNGGTCTDKVNGFSCSCVTGFAGPTCEINVDDCGSNPCQNGGICTDGVNSFTCACPLGWDGPTCTTNIDDCDPNPCLHGGVCTDKVNGFTCDCEDNYTGPTCDDDVDECAADATLCGEDVGAGTCQNTDGAYTCDCADGYYGDGTTTCATCDALPNCLAVTCQASGASTCTTCGDDYVVDNGVCVTAPCGLLGEGCPTGFTCSTSAAVGTSYPAFCVSTATDEVAVPAGTFWIGCNPTTDGSCEGNESPQRRVTTTAYAIQRTEVSAQDYWDWCGNSVSVPVPGASGYCMPDQRQRPGGLGTYKPLSGDGPWTKQDHPMTFPTWYQARGYCLHIGRDLCTEAQWERAARGGCETLSGDCKTSMRKYPWGNNAPTCTLANHDTIAGIGGFCEPTTRTADVDSRAAGASPYGAINMAGNAWEWTKDWYAGSPPSSSPASGTYKTFRGGGHDELATESRASRRVSGYKPTIFLYSGGFRCCRSL